MIHIVNSYEHFILRQRSGSNSTLAGNTFNIYLSVNIQTYTPNRMQNVVFEQRITETKTPKRNGTNTQMIDNVKRKHTHTEYGQRKSIKRRFKINQKCAPQCQQ